jgi:hypothetical protein
MCCPWLWRRICRTFHLQALHVSEHVPSANLPNHRTIFRVFEGRNVSLNETLETWRLPYYCACEEEAGSSLEGAPVRTQDPSSDKISLYMQLELYLAI